MNKLAIFGFGRWGRVLIAEFSKLVSIKYAVNNGDIKDIKWLKKNFPAIKHTVGVALVLSQKDIESVIVAAPISTHYTLAKKSLDLGKNVFVEKPPCLNSKEGFELLRLAKLKKRTLFVDNTYLFDPAFAKLKKITASQKPLETRFTWLKWGSFDSDIVWNLAYHDIYLSLNLYGNPQRSRIISRSANKVEIKLIYTNHRVLILIDRSYKGLPSKSILVKLDSKKYLLQNSYLYDIKNEHKKLIFKSNINPLSIACKKFVSEINKKRKDYKGFELSIETVNIIEKMIEKF